jgi:FkbM family methyltransferase
VYVQDIGMSGRKFARWFRDLARGLLGTYLIEQRLIELRDAARDSGRLLDVIEARVKAAEAAALAAATSAAESKRLMSQLEARVKAAEAAALAAATSVAESKRLMSQLEARAEERWQTRVGNAELGIQQLTDLAAHTVIRDVGIAVYMGFPSYFYRQDAAFKSLTSDGPRPGVIDISLETARDLVAERIANRRRHPRGEMIRDYWSHINKHNYNGMHPLLLTLLHEIGMPADFVDVGANVGDTAMVVAEAIETLGLDASVYSFEPGPVFDLARANVALNQLNGRATVHNVAASDTPGFVPMQILIGHSESGSVGGISTHFDLPLGETRFVRAVRLDEFLATLCPSDSARSYLIKIDAEGVDFAVVRGARGLIESGRAPIITLEFTPKYNSTADNDAARALLRDYALFNLRGLDCDGHFDRFDLVSPDDFSQWVEDVAASPHGWVDVAFISREIVESAPMMTFRAAYESYVKERDVPATSHRIAGRDGTK